MNQPCTSRLSEANRREYVKVMRLVLVLMERAQDHPGRGDHAELRLTWNAQGAIQGDLRASLAAFMPDEKSA